MTSRFFRVVSLPGSGLVGVTTVKALGHRPGRNRQKRRIREISRHLGLHHESLDWVVVVKSQVANATFEELNSDLSQIHQEMCQRWASA